MVLITIRTKLFRTKMLPTELSNDDNENLVEQILVTTIYLAKCWQKQRTQEKLQDLNWNRTRSDIIKTLWIQYCQKADTYAAYAWQSCQNSGVIR